MGRTGGRGETAAQTAAGVTCSPTPASPNPCLLPTWRSAGTRETAGPQVTPAVWSEESLVQDPQRSWDRKACCYGWGLQQASPSSMGAHFHKCVPVCATHWPQPGSTEAAPSPASQPIHLQATGLLQRPPGPTRSIPSAQTSWRSGQQDSAHNFTDEETNHQLSENRGWAGAIALCSRGWAGSIPRREGPRYGLASALLHGCTCPWCSFSHDPHVSFEGLSGNEHGQCLRSHSRWGERPPAQNKCVS